MRQKRLLRIELSRGTGGSVYVGVSPSDCVLSIKHKLETLTGIPIPTQTLYHAATQLSDSTPLHEFCGSTPVTNLDLHVPIRGGACRPTIAHPPIHCYDVTDDSCYIIRKFPPPDYSRPEYSCFTRKGMSLRAKCSNKECPSVKKGYPVMIKKRMFENTNGCCSIRSEVSKMICPACNSKIPSCNLENLYFAGCTFTIEWLLSDEVTEGSIEKVLKEDESAKLNASKELKKYAFLKVKMK